MRTNSEAITAILDGDPEADLSRGPAISSDFYPDPVTHITQNRLAQNEGFMRFYQGPLVDGERPRVRALKTVGQMLAHPTRTLRVWGARNLPKRLSVLTVMQYLDNELAFRYGRLPTAPWRSGLRSVSVPGKKAPTYLAVANEATRKFAEVSGGEPLNMLMETVGSKSITAHILGGAVMGTSAEQGVIDPRHEVFGHRGLYVMDASAISANLGVNPSLTITALAERFASLIPPAEGAGHPASTAASARVVDRAARQRPRELTEPTALQRKPPFPSWTKSMPLYPTNGGTMLELTDPVRDNANHIGRGRRPGNKGRRYPADPPRVEEIVAVMRQAGTDRYGQRLRGLIIVLWRAGLRISEALALTESDLEVIRGQCSSVAGRADVAERSGWISGPGISCAPGSRHVCRYLSGRSSA